MSTAPMPAEGRVLLLTAGGLAADRDIAAVLSGGIDWRVLCWLAEDERATPIVWRRIQEVLGRRVPAGADLLRRRALVAEFQMAHLEHRLEQLLRAYTDRGIEVVLLKGAALATTLYGGFDQRPMGDVDLLVDPSQAEQAWRLALECGWKIGPEGSETQLWREHHHMQPLDDASGIGVSLEVHTEPFMPGSPFQLDAAAIRRRSRTAGLRSAPTRVPALHDQLLHLCLHFAWSHALTTGSWRTFRDLRVMLEGNAIDWDEFIADVRSSPAASGCYWTFRLAGVLSGVHVPDRVIRSLRPPRSELVLGRQERHFVQCVLPIGQGCPSVQLSRAVWSWAMPGVSGPGTIQPWTRQASFLGNAIGPSVLQRMRHHIRNAGAWRRYLRALLQNPAPRTSAR